MKIIIALVIVITTSTSFGQDFGFFGKKNVISLNGLANIPLIYLMADNGTTTYKKSGSKLIDGKNLLDYGMNVSFSHAFSGRFALGFEYALNFAKFNGPNQGVIHNEEYGYYFDAIYLKHEQMSMRTMTFMPKIEFSMLGEQLPFGINHQFGVGFATTKLIEKDYVVEIDYQYFNNPTIEAIFNENDVYRKPLKNLNGLTVMYGFNVRTPISKSILINYGIRYTLNTSFNFDEIFGSSGNASKYYVKENEMHSLMGRKRLTSILAFNIGINYVF